MNFLIMSIMVLLDKMFFYKLQKKIKLSEKEKQNIIDNAISLIEIKYNKKLSNFEKIEFEK